MLPARVHNVNIVKMVNDVVAWAALIVALGTLAAVIYQSYVYTRQMKIADDQLRLAQDQEQKSLRAYTGSYNATMTGFTPPNTINISNTIASFGQTPAYSINITWQSNDEFLHDNNVFPTDLTRPIFQTTNQTLYPNSNRNWNKTITVPLNSFDEVKAKIRVITYYGNVTYEDVFGNHNMTHFCYFIDSDLITQLLAAKGQPIGIYRCNNYNDGK